MFIRVLLWIKEDHKFQVEIYDKYTFFNIKCVCNFLCGANTLHVPVSLLIFCPLFLVFNEVRNVKWNIFFLQFLMYSMKYVGVWKFWVSIFRRLFETDIFQAVFGSNSHMLSCLFILINKRNLRLKPLQTSAVNLFILKFSTLPGLWFKHIICMAELLILFLSFLTGKSV